MLLAIDIGGTSIKYGLISRDYKINEVGSFPTEKKSYEKLIERLTSLHNNFDYVEGIAIAVPGVVEEDGRSSGISAIECIYNQNIKKDLERITNKVVTIQNDANCSLLSEMVDDKNADNLAAIVIGTGIGGAAIINNKILKGFSGSAGEFGAILNSYDEIGKVELQSISTGQLTSKYSNFFNNNLNGIKIFEEFYNGNEIAIKAIKEFFNKLAILSFNIQYILNPETIIFSGAITNEPKFIELFNEAYDLIKNKNSNMYIAPSKFKVSKYKSQANLIGASYLWYEEKEKTNEEN